MRGAFAADLERLETALREEGALVREALRAMLAVLERRDVELAGEVVAFDDRIDEHHRAIEQAVEALLALQQPVAGDLRLVLAVQHISRSLERIGDQCVTVAKLIQLADGLSDDDGVLAALHEMGQRARRMTRVALESLERRDVARAEQIEQLDDPIDDLNRFVFRQAIELGTDPDRREWAIHMVLAARALERIGDNAVDIAERALYLVTGELRELTDASSEPA